MKKVLSIVLSVLMVFAVFSVAVSAADAVYNKEIKVDTVTKVSLDEGESYIYGFKPEKTGNYTVFSRSDVKVKLIANGKTYNPGGQFGGVSNNFYVGNMSLTKGNTYTFAVSSVDSKACEFDFYLVNSANVAVQIVKTPVKNSYADGFEVTVKNDKVVFNREIDFTGAEINVFPFGLTKESFNVKDNEVLLYVNNTKYVPLTNMYSMVFGGTILPTTIDLIIAPYPIKRVVIWKDADTSTYHFGKDGAMSGSAFKPVYAPYIKLEGLELAIQFNDGRENEIVPVLADGKGGYYIETSLGRVAVTAYAETQSAGTCEVTVSVADETVTYDITIEEATFLEKFVLFFKMLFGII